MVGDIRFADVILRSFVDGKIDRLDQKCLADADSCGGISITQDQEDIIGYTLSDGNITTREKEMLGFMPPAIVAGIAGADGKKPARMMARVLVKRLAEAKTGEIPHILKQLARLDPATRKIALPEVNSTLSRIEKEWEDLNKEIDSLEKQNLTLAMLEQKLSNPADSYYTHWKFFYARTALTSYIDNKNVSDEQSIPLSVMRMMTIDELTVLTSKGNDHRPLSILIERFPNSERTKTICHGIIRQIKNTDADALDVLNDKSAMAAIQYFASFRSRLETIIDEAPDVALPMLLAANPKENVSGLIIERIVKTDKDQYWKEDSLKNAFNNRADKQTLLDAAEAIITLDSTSMMHANDTLGVSLFNREDISPGAKAWVFHKLYTKHRTDPNWPDRFGWSSVSPIMRKNVMRMTYMIANREQYYNKQINWIEDYAICLSGEFIDRNNNTLHPDVCDSREETTRTRYNYDGYALSEEHRKQIRSAMENGATKLYFIPSSITASDRIGVPTFYLDGNIVGVE